MIVIGSIILYVIVIKLSLFISIIHILYDSC